MQLSKRRAAAKPRFSKAWLAMTKKNNDSECRQADSAVGIWTVPAACGGGRCDIMLSGLKVS